MRVADLVAVYSGWVEAESNDPVVAIYDPGSDSWDRAPASPLRARSYVSGSADSTTVTFWGGQIDGRPARDGFSLDLETRQWTAVPDAPVNSRLPTAAWG